MRRARGKPFELEQRALGKDGNYRWFLVRFNPLRDDQGYIIRWYATGTDIEDRKRAVERADLFYRLNVFPIEVPPLRKRREDIPMLVEYFVKRYAEKGGKQIRKIDNNTPERCQSYAWPGIFANCRTLLKDR
jgi:transcriptional regulator with AAA-type ATPase domain